MNTLFKVYRYVLYGFLYLIELDIYFLWVQVFVPDRIFITNLITLWITLRIISSYLSFYVLVVKLFTVLRDF